MLVSTVEYSSALLAPQVGIGKSRQAKTFSEAMEALGELHTTETA